MKEEQRINFVFTTKARPYSMSRPHGIQRRSAPSSRVISDSMTCDTLLHRD